MAHIKDGLYTTLLKLLQRPEEYVFLISFLEHETEFPCSSTKL